MKKFLLVVIAEQLLKGAKTFAGAEVKGQSVIKGEGSVEFALVPYQGGVLKVSEGDWLVTYDDGVKELFNDETFQSKFSPAPETEETEAELITAAELFAPGNVPADKSEGEE